MPMFKCVRILFCGFLFCAVPTWAAPVAQTPPEPPKDYHVTWATSLTDSHLVDDLSNQKNQVVLGLLIDFDMEFSDWMSIDLAPNFVAQNGYIQSPNVVDPQTSRIDIINAALNIKPANYFQMSAGSLSERTYHSNIFMSNRSFPAARLVSNIGSPKGDHFYFYAETAIPTSSSISNNASDLNQTPSLNMAGLGGSWGNERTFYWLYGGISAYEFSGMSQDLSTASVLLGNSGVNSSGTTYLFQYQYQGVEANLFWRAHLTRTFAFEIRGSAIENTQAPTQASLGWVVGGGFVYDINRLFEIAPKFEYFSIQSDATVAIYNDEFYNTNRTGYRFELDMKYNRKINLILGYGQRVALQQSASQPGEDVYMLGFETMESKF
jgi:hypothetical protein